MSSSTIDKNDKKDSTGSAFTFDDEVSSDDEMLQPGKVKNFKGGQNAWYKNVDSTRLRSTPWMTSPDAVKCPRDCLPPTVRRMVGPTYDADASRGE